MNRDVDVYATGPQSQRSSPVFIADADDNVNTLSRMEQSEVQFNPAALERARQAGWCSQPRNAGTIPLMTPADFVKSTMQVQRNRIATAAQVGHYSSLQATVNATVGHPVGSSIDPQVLSRPIEDTAYTLRRLSPVHSPPPMAIDANTILRLEA